MNQVLPSLKSGTVEVAEVREPAVCAGALLIRTRASLISSGTERMLLEFGRAGWLEKARQQPDKVRQVLEKIRTVGLWPAVITRVNSLGLPCAGKLAYPGQWAYSLREGSGFYRCTAPTPGCPCCGLGSFPFYGSVWDIVRPR